MRELGRKGGRAKTRRGMAGKEIPTDLRARLRSEVDEDTLARVIVETVEGGSHRERFDAVKLILSELAEAKKPAERCICTSGQPRDYCKATSPHGYVREPGAMHFSLGDLLGEAIEHGLIVAELGGPVVIAGKPVSRVDPALPRGQTPADPPAVGPPAPEPQLAELVDDQAPKFEEGEAARPRRRYGNGGTEWHW